MNEFIRLKKGQIFDLGLMVYVYEEEGRRVAYTPALELSGIGNTDKEAIKDLTAVIEITFDYAITKGTVDQMLFDLGWKKVSDKVIEAPVFSDEEVRHRIPTPNFQRYQETVAITA